MAIRSVILIFLAAVAALFLVVNWPAIMAPVPVNLVYMEVTAPLGLLLLIGFGTLWVVGIIWALLDRASVLLEVRRAYKEANSSKHLADHAEESRLQEARQALQEAVERVDVKMAERTEAASQQLNERLATLTAAVEKLGAQVHALEALSQQIQKTNDKIDVLRKQGVVPAPEQDVKEPEVPAAPAPEPKKGFFGFFSSDPKPAEPKPEPVVEAPAPAPEPEPAPAPEPVKTEPVVAEPAPAPVEPQKKGFFKSLLG